MVKWIISKEKEMLRSDIVNGIVLGTMSPEEVYDMHDGAYHVFPFKNFRVNLKNLRAAMIRSFRDAQEDEDCLVNTLKEKNPLTGDQAQYPKWSNSIAQTLLGQDIEAGIFDQMAPATLWTTRPEYMEFPLTVFRNHIYKEKMKPLARSYWDNQRALTLEKRRKR